MCKRPAIYSVYVIDRFIRISRSIQAKYEEIKESPDIRRSFLIHIGGGSCQICEYVGQFKLSCKKICPFVVCTGELCTEQKSYNNLSELTDRDTSKAIQIKILDARIEFHKKLQETLETLKYKDYNF